MTLTVLGDYVINLYTVPIILVAAVSLGLGLVTLLRNRLTPLYWMFLAFTTILAIWATNLAFLLSATDSATASMWGRLLITEILAIPPFLYLFVCLMNERAEAEKYYLIACYAGSIILGYFILFTPAITNDVHNYSWGYYPKYSGYHYLYMAFFVTSLVKAIHVLYREMTDESNEDIHVQRNQSIFVGTLIGSFGTIDLFPFYGFNLIPFGFVFILAGLVIYAFAISEYKLTGLTDDRLASKIFMTIDEAVVVTDRNGNIELVNEAAETLLNLEAPELKGRKLTDFLGQTEFLQFLPGHSEDSVDSNKSASYECGLTDNDGKEYDVRLKVTQLEEKTNRTSDQAWYVFVAEDTTELTEIQTRLEEIRYENSISGLPNREMLDQQLEKDEFSEGCQSAVYILVKDLQNIKTNLRDEGLYNYLINSIASRLKIILPAENLYHINESEFFAFTTENLDLETVLNEKRDELTREMDLGDRSIHLNYSIGVSQSRPVDEAFRFCQSTAVNDASNQPGTAITHFSKDVSQEHREYFDVKHNIINAIRDDRIQVYFHPQIRNGSIRGAEALIRWEHEQHGFIAPPKIVRAAIEMNHEKQLFNHVLTNSVSQAKNWDSDEMLAVNIAAKQLEHGSRLQNQIQTITDQKDFDTGRLEIELTEQAATRNIDETRKLLEGLKDLDIEVSIDDFGTGYSSFKSLIELPIDNLKIDKSFVMNIQEDSKNKRIVETTRDMAKSLGLKIIAEGVESPKHIQYLQTLEIEVMQGFYWTSPLSPDNYQNFRLNGQLD